MKAIEIDGFEELEELLLDMTITETDEKKAMKKAIQAIAEEVESNSPERTGRLKRNIKTVVKKDGFATVGVVKLNAIHSIFQEFGTSKQKAHVGFFERSVSKAQNESISILGKELLGKIK